MSTSVTGRLDKDGIKLAARGRWFKEILPALGFDRDSLDGRHCPCDKCGGTDRFRAIDADAGAVICNRCFAEENGDGFAALMWLNNWTFPQALKAVAEVLGIQANHDSQGTVSQPIGIVEKMARIKRVPLAAWLAFGAHEAIRTTARGELTVCRIPMYDAKGQQCSYCDFADISDGSRKGWNAKDKPVGLFYAKRPQPGELIILCEGPKDAAAAHSLGFNAVGLPGCDMETRLTPAFKGCDVVTAADLDDAGQNSAPITAARLIGIANTVRIARLPGEMKKTSGDGVREVLAKKDGEAQLRKAIEDAVLWSPPSEQLGSPVSTTGSEWTSLRTDQGRTDLANSRRFLATYGELVRYCHPWGKWLIWTGTHWQIDDSGALLRLAKAVADQVWMDAKHCLDRDVASFAVKTSGRASLRAMLDLAAADVPISVAEMDANLWLLNCPNGTVDLRTGTLRPHRREDFITKICPTNYIPGSDATEFCRFMESVFCDSLLIQFLQRYLGQCLSGDVSEQILAVFYGTGSNGKSTLLNLIQVVLGTDYTSAAPPCLLMEKKTEGHPTELAGLFGKRFVVAQETNAGSRLAEATVKFLTGSDPITGRRMREDFWSFLPTHKLVLCTNHKPRIRGTDHAIWRRLVLVPFERRFWNPAKGEDGPEELRQDKELPRKLAAEAEGILAWLVQGCVEWRLGGLQIPDLVRVATEEYRSEEDSTGRFIADCCLTGTIYKVKFSSLYKAFEDWCNDAGDNVPSRKFFGQWLKDKQFKDHSSNGRWYEGIALRNEFTE